MSLESSGNTTLLKIRNSNVRLSRSAVSCPNRLDRVRIDRIPSRCASLSEQGENEAKFGSTPTDLMSGSIRSKTMPLKLLNVPIGDTMNIESRCNSEMEIILTSPDGHLTRCGSEILDNRQTDAGDIRKTISYSSDFSSGSSLCEDISSINSEMEFWNELEEQNSDYDTDLEEDSNSSKKSEHSQRKSYKNLCENAGVVPSSVFMRDMSTPEVNLSHSYLTSKDMKIIAAALVNNATVIKLSLSGNDIGAKGIMYVAEALTDNVYLSELDLSEVNIGKHDGMCLRKLVDALLHNRTITKLNLSGNHLSRRHALDLARLIKRNDFIVHLDLSKNDLDEAAGNEMANAIASNLTLHTLNLSWNHLRKTGAAAVVKAICDNVELLHADLSWNGLGPEGSLAIQNCIANNKTLQTLDISNNRIGFLDIGPIMKGLNNNESIRTLKINGNPITTKGAIALMKMCEKSSQCGLKEIYLTDVPANDEFMECVESLKTTKDILVHHPDPIGMTFEPVKMETTMQDFDPVLLLFEYMKQENYRLIDLFRTLDTDQDNTISREEFKEGFLRLNINLTDDGLNRLLEKLDVNENEVVDFDEMKMGRRKATMKIKDLCTGSHSERYTEMVNSIRRQLLKARKDRIEVYSTNRLEERSRSRNNSKSPERSSANAKVINGIRNKSPELSPSRNGQKSPMLRQYRNRQKSPETIQFKNGQKSPEVSPSRNSKKNPETSTSRNDQKSTQRTFSAFKRSSSVTAIFEVSSLTKNISSKEINKMN